MICSAEFSLLVLEFLLNHQSQHWGSTGLDLVRGKRSKAEAVHC